MERVLAQKHYGFSLIELAVIILLVSLAMVGFVTTQQEENAMEKPLDSSTDLSSIKNALELVK